MALRNTDEIVARDETVIATKMIKYIDVETVDTFGASEEVAGLDEYRLATSDAPVNKVSGDNLS